MYKEDRKLKHVRSGKNILYTILRVSHVVFVGWTTWRQISKNHD